MYQKAAQDGQPGQAAGAEGTDAPPQEDDDVVDADFEEVKKDK